VIQPFTTERLESPAILLVRSDLTVERRMPPESMGGPTSTIEIVGKPYASGRIVRASGQPLPVALARPGSL
jgi:hypothetical protein